MTPHQTSLADRFAGLRAALQERPGELRPAHRAALDAMLLALIATLLGRLERLARTWHPATGRQDSARERPAPHSPMALLPPDLRYLFGPRRNRGMRPRARTAPIARPRTARAPPPIPARKNPPPPWAEGPMKDRSTAIPADFRGLPTLRHSPRTQIITT